MTENDILKYFSAEKNESLVFAIIGILAMIIAFYGMFSIRTAFFRGLFFPLVIVALIQVTVGASVYLRTPKDIERVTAQLNNEPEKLESEEMPRMSEVNKNFVIYRYVEIALALIGILICLSFKRGSFWFGMGVGLTIQSLIMLGADYFAEKRALEYTEILKNYLHYKFTS